MTAYSQSSKTSVWQKTVGFTLSAPVQATLYISLSALTLWTVYFSGVPAVHNQLHSLRHHTLLVNCH